MKRIICLLALAIAAIGCSKEWQSSIEIGLNTQRINIASTDAGEFCMTVFSGIDWTVAVEEGGEWLVPVRTSGHGMQTLFFNYGDNEAEDARAAYAVFTASTGKTARVAVVQAGSVQKATDFLDQDLKL